MPGYVALLRGINVGGHGRMRMADLRQMAAGCGFTAISTYIQSGNLAFASPDPAATVAARLAAVVVTQDGRRPPIAVRSHAELAELFAGNPYLTRTTDPTQLH